MTPHIEVTGHTMTAMGSGSGLLLHVRRSSDPSNLHQIGLDSRSPTLNGASGGGGVIVNGMSDHLMVHDDQRTKRWSAAPVCRGDECLLMGPPQLPPPIPTTTVSGDVPSTDHRKGGRGFLSPSWESDLEDPHPNQLYATSAQPDSMPTQFSRSGRLSMQFLGDGNGYKWIDAAEKVAAASATSAASGLSGGYTSKSLPRESKRKEPLGQAYESIREKSGEMLLIVNETGGPLGLTAIPDMDNGGLLVQNVEAGSRAERGRLRRGDRILEINGTKLVGLSEASVQSHLRHSCAAAELRLRVIRTATASKRLQQEINEMIEAEEKAATKVATVSPTRKLHGAQAGNQLQAANTRKLGRKIEITLRKGPQGLGFSVTTRDNPAGGHCPIYIKTILPRGAAIEDGRLKPGDRLLEVDGVTMTGRTQTDVVQILRATQAGATVQIVVSRQQDGNETGGGATTKTTDEEEREVVSLRENFFFF